MSIEVDKHHIELAFNITGNTTAMLAYYDKNLICRFANNAHLDWLGIHPEDMVDKMHISDVLGPLYKKNLNAINGALSGTVQALERRDLTPSGITKTIRTSYLPKFDGGEVKGIYVRVADTTPIPSVDELYDIEDKRNHLFSNGHLLEDVVQTLKSCMLTEFPGIEKLSKQHFISESKLKRDFKERYNTTVFTFYRNLQMELADKYICENRCNKSQMAQMLNFSNPSNFSVCYQKYLREKKTADQINKIKAMHDELFKTFVEQAPVDIAMLDNNLVFMTASERFLNTRKINANDYIGKYIFDVIPGTSIKYEEMLRDCLKGNTNVTKEAFIQRPDGSSFWLNWEIKPWYTIDKQIGGLVIFTENITAEKLKEAENKQISEILAKTNEIARIGTWYRDFNVKKGFYDKILKQILEVPDDYVAEFENGIRFYKEGYSRQLIEKVIKAARENGEAFDVTVEIITYKGNLKTVRVIGFPQLMEGVCDKISGIYQELASPEAGAQNISVI